MAVSKPNIIDRRKSALGYPSRTSQAGNRRSHNQIKYIGWHYTATTGGSISGHENYWGRTLGWGLGGYTYYIDRAGRIYQNYDWAVRTNGVAGWNTATLNMSLEASNKNNYTAAQIKSREHLTLWLMQELKISAQNVKGHKEFSGQSTACPGYNTSEMNAFRSKLAQLSKTKYSAPKANSGEPWTKVKSEKAMFIATTTIRRREKPAVKSKQTGTIKAGDVIAYNGLFHNDGYSWLEYIDEKDGYQYFPYMEHSEGKPWGKLMSIDDYNSKYVPKVDKIVSQFNVLKKGAKATIGSWASHYQTGERISDWIKGTELVIDDVKTFEKSHSILAYKLKNGNTVIGWVLEQDIVEADKGQKKKEIAEMNKKEESVEKGEAKPIEEKTVEQAKKEEPEAKEEKLKEGQFILNGIKYQITEVK